MKNNKSYIIRASADGGHIRAFAADTRDVTEAARAAHNLSPIASAALGRTMTAALMMGSMLKNDSDLLTIKLKGAGPMKGITVTADSKGHVKGFVEVPDVLLPPNAKGKLDVGGAIGAGELIVIRDMGLKDPYLGQVELQTGEIADDLTYYFAVSEQTPSAVSLGVLMNKDNTVRQSGGFILQLMPDVKDEVIDIVEERLKDLESMTDLLEKGMSPETILERLLGDMDLQILERKEVSFRCDCSREKVEKALISVGKEELDSMIKDNEPVEVKCHFCGKAYRFSIEDLITLKNNSVK
ncbi:MAG: Hsp33 family molecular chaperone HslO [Lachnospiraceae bacterium]|nr:Hsp33 family molecular chaperone HslO [Lachnospiraceae bacterium]